MAIRTPTFREGLTVPGVNADSRNRSKQYEVNERAQKDGPSVVNSSLSYAVEPPKLSNSALYGLAGEIVKKIEPHTETHPAALLLQLLIGFGNMVGRNAYFVTERDHHHTNLFGVIVGESARGRKGTAWGQIRYLLERVDPEWESKRILSGVASGEGVIRELKDRDDGQPQDKRLLLMESEFGGVLKVMQKDGNTVSAIVRNAWDTGTLRNLANINRNKNGVSLRATDCHISIIGHITRAELSKLLDSNDTSNGFANRFLWVHSSRTKLLPDGGDIAGVNFDEEIERLQVVGQLARRRGEMRRSEEAREYWHKIYPDLTTDRPGRWGQVTSRGEAQVVRLALTFSLLDGSEHITLPHLRAAEAVWSYCSDSAPWAFMEPRFSRRAQLLLSALERGPLTLSEVSSEVFQRNITHSEIELTIREIEEFITTEKKATGGRDATVISLRAQGGASEQ